MRRQSAIVLAVAIFFGLIAVYLVNTYLGAAEKQRAEDPAAMTQVAVAMVPLGFGAAVTPEKTRLVSWPADSVPPGAVQSLAELRSGGKTSVVLRPIEVGEPILKSKLSGVGGRATLSAVLPPEMRATAIRITDVAGVAGFVLPGDRVDVILTRAVAGGGAGEQVAETLLQDVRVIAIDQDSNDAADKPVIGKTATLEVQPYDAQKLALAQNVGTLSLALRSATAQQGPMYTEAVSTGDLRGGSGGGAFMNASFQPAAPMMAPRASRPRIVRAAAPKPPKLTNSVEVVRGTASVNYEVGRYGAQ